MKHFKFTSFGKEYEFDTLDDLKFYVLKNSISTDLELYQRENNSNSFASIGEISEWID